MTADNELTVFDCFSCPNTAILIQQNDDLV